MAVNVLKDIRKVLSTLRAQEIRNSATREIRVGLLASDEDIFRRMEGFLAPAAMDPVSRAQALRSVHRIDGSLAAYDFILCAPGIPVPKNGYVFESEAPGSLTSRIATGNELIELALARTFPMFRTAVSDRIIGRVARENAFFSMMTALPGVIPNLIELPWAVGEFASDTVFLTMNQIRMALMLSAAYGQPVGYSEQKAEIVAILAGALGWRALARELAGKIPFGAGLIPKAAIAFAGTFVAGLGVEKLKRTGSGLSRQEKKDAWAEAFSRGREVAKQLTPGSHDPDPAAPDR